MRSSERLVARPDNFSMKLQTAAAVPPPLPPSSSPGSPMSIVSGGGHAMAPYGVLKNGPTAPTKHVGSSGSHGDEVAEIRLDGIAAR